MPVAFSVELDRKKLVKTELELLFAELLAAINVTRVEPQDITFSTIQYRHLKVVPKIGLSQQFGYPEDISFRGPFTSFYEVSESILYHDSSHTAAPNRDVPDQGVVHVSAVLFISDVGDSVTITRATIGVSNDDGVTWTPLTTVSRPFGLNAGECIRVFDTPGQLHYHTGIAGYYGFNGVNFDRGIVLTASLGGDVENASLAGRTAFCVMTDTTVTGPGGRPLLAGVIFLNARERGF